MQLYRGLESVIGGLAITSDVRCKLLILHVFVNVNGKIMLITTPLADFIKQSGGN